MQLLLNSIKYYLVIIHFIKTCIIVTLYCTSTSHICKNSHKTDISKFLKIVKFDVLKKTPKMYRNNIVCSKHVLDTYTTLYTALKVHKYY